MAAIERRFSRVVSALVCAGQDAVTGVVMPGRHPRRWRQHFGNNLVEADIVRFEDGYGRV